MVAIAIALSLVSAGHAADTPQSTADAKPRIAVFPLGGDGRADLRERTAFSLRAKLDRQGRFEVIDGPRMQEVTAQTQTSADFGSTLDSLKLAADAVDADVLIWGELARQTDGVSKLRVHLVDRRAGGKAKEVEKVISEPTDLRFAVEEALAVLPQVSPFEHPSEEAVQRDKVAEVLWKKSLNLVVNGDFSQAGKWQGIYQAEKYEVATQDRPPAEDKVVIQRVTEGGITNNVLAMKLSQTCAENNGMACLSQAIKIKPKTRYRLSFRYKSDGPVLHVFVKGHTLFPNINGELVERENYRRQVPPTGGTQGQWVTIEDDLNPQHVQYAVQTLRIDLYAYLKPGTVMFDDVVLKAVGEQTRDARDAAIKPAATRPRSAK